MSNRAFQLFIVYFDNVFVARFCLDAVPALEFGFTWFQVRAKARALNVVSVLVLHHCIEGYLVHCCIFDGQDTTAVDIAFVNGNGFLKATGHGGGGRVHQSGRCGVGNGRYLG